MTDRITQGTETAQQRDPVEQALHTFLWEEGLRVSERTERCTGQDARALAEVLTPVVRGLMADAVRQAAFADLSVARFAAEESLPECHKAKCHQRHPDADEIVSLVWKRLRDTMIEQSIFVRQPDGEDECDGCVCPTEHDGDYGSAGHAGPCPPHTCALRFPPAGVER